MSDDDDIIERLRWMACMKGNGDQTDNIEGEIASQAADEIERLRAELGDAVHEVGRLRVCVERGHGPDCQFGALWRFPDE